MKKYIFIFAVLVLSVFAHNISVNAHEIATRATNVSANTKSCKSDNDCKVPNNFCCDGQCSDTCN